MDKIALLRKQIRSIASDSKEIFFSATIVSIQENTCTIDVDGLELDGVRLKPTTATTENKVLLTPAEGSDVLVGSFSGDFSNLFVLSADEVENIEITCNGQNVMQLLSQLIQTLAKAQVITPLGNGTFDPGVISQLNMIETSFKQIFK